LSEIHSKHAAREAAFQAAYQCTTGGSSIAKAIEEALARNKYAPEAEQLVRSLAEGAVTAVAELDARYAPYLKGNWTPDRLSLIDRLVLRMAVFELWSLPNVPPKVTITEAVKLAKRFGSAESGGFVNAVLGKVLEDSPKKEWVAPVASAARPARIEPDADPQEKSQPAADAPQWTLRSDEEE
jgi:transcription antitermination factor NusB